jgi:hypothetical protein
MAPVGFPFRRVSLLLATLILSRDCSILLMVQDPTIQLIQYVPDRTSFDSDSKLFCGRLTMMAVQAAPTQMILCVAHCSSF